MWLDSCSNRYLSRKLHQQAFLFQNPDMEEWSEWWNRQTFLNRVVFLTGSKLVMDAVREAAPLIRQMGNHYQALAAESLKRLPKSNDPDALKQWAESFARKLAHAPIKGLRVLATEAGASAVQAYMRGVEIGRAHV